MDEHLLDEAALARLVDRAAAFGLARLGVVRLDHPGFAEPRAALDRYLAEGRQGEMDFLARTAEIRRDPRQMLPDAASLLIAAVPYGGPGGRIARYARATDYHTEIHHRLRRLEHALHAEVPGCTSLICVDTKPILERSAAALAGLGFIGKHGCVIAPGLGSYILLGGLLTSARWCGPDALPDLRRAGWDACGSCTRCLDACPTGAFDGPGTLDPRRCISYLTIEHRGPIPDELADAMGERIAGCDVCQEVCPYNAGGDRERRVPAAAWLGPPLRGTRDDDPLPLVDIGSSTYRAWVKGTPVRRIPRRSMRRNALIAIGNASGPLSAAAQARVQSACNDSDPQVASAARRALTRKGRPEP